CAPRRPPARRADHLRAPRNNQKKNQKDRATLRAAPASAARRAYSKRKYALATVPCASRKLQPVRKLWRFKA
ncbi:hypothetical protein A2U01_0089663, partial [Trifolium medium]|nr:hypothetical protein [Trifolium medium]